MTFMLYNHFSSPAY